MSPVHSGALIPAYAAHARLRPGQKPSPGNLARHKGHDTAARSYDGKVSLLAGQKVSICGGSLMMPK